MDSEKEFWYQPRNGGGGVCVRVCVRVSERNDTFQLLEVYNFFVLFWDRLERGSINIRQSLNTWNYHYHSVVSVDHKQQLRADRSERWT